MRIVNFETHGVPGIAADEGSGWHGLSQPDSGFPGTLPELIAQGADLLHIGRTLGQSPGIDLKAVHLLPPVPAPSKILCVGLNYDDHLEESGLKKPEYPEIFARFASSLIAHQDPIRRPRESTTLDYEAELAVVIGTPGRRIPQGRPLITWPATPCSMIRPCVTFSSAHRNGRWARISMAPDRSAHGW
jgi:acylpyruvate hydrolase